MPEKTTAADIKVRIVAFDEKGERQESAVINLEELYRTMDKNELELEKFITSDEDSVWHAYVHKN